MICSLPLHSLKTLSQRRRFSRSYFNLELGDLTFRDIPAPDSPNEEGENQGGVLPEAHQCAASFECVNRLVADFYRGGRLSFFLQP
jgi:hypothetical protein